MASQVFRTALLYLFQAGTFTSIINPNQSMRHYRNTTGVSYNDTASLLYQVSGILDSRIQFIDFRVQRYFTSCTSAISNSSKNGMNYSDTSTPGFSVNKLDQLLSFTEKLQNDLKLLQTLKAWLKEETAQYILDLLTNNKYLDFSEQNLEYLLKQKALTFYQNYT